jgi:hypothetical protein
MIRRKIRVVLRTLRGFLYRHLPGCRWDKRLQGYERRWGLETGGFPKEGFIQACQDRLLGAEKPGWFMEIKPGDGIIGSLGYWLEQGTGAWGIAAWEDRPFPAENFRQKRPTAVLFRSKFGLPLPPKVFQRVVGITVRANREASAVCRAIRKGDLAPTVCGIWNPNRRDIWDKRMKLLGYRLELVYQRMEFYKKRKTLRGHAQDALWHPALLIYEKIRNKANWRKIPRRAYERSTLFIHIPKNAGTAVSSALYGFEVGHHPYCWYRERFPHSLQKLVTFAIIRKPEERFVSAFEYLKAGGNNPEDSRFAQENLKPFAQAKELVQKCLESPQFFSLIKEKHHHFRPQHEYVTWNGRLAVEYLIDFEKLPSDLAKIPGASRWIGNLERKNARTQPVSAPKDTAFSEGIRSLYPEDHRLWQAVATASDENRLS